MRYQIRPCAKTPCGSYELHIPDSQIFLCKLTLRAQTCTHICWYMQFITESSLMSWYKAGFAITQVTAVFRYISQRSGT